MFVNYTLGFLVGDVHHIAHIGCGEQYMYTNAFALTWGRNRHHLISNAAL